MNKTRIGLLFYMAAGISMIVGIGFLCIQKKLAIDDPSAVAWFALQLIGMTIAVSFTFQYAIALYFNADGNYEPSEVELNAGISGFATVITVLLLIAARYYGHQVLALYLFVIFEVGLFAFLFLYSWIPNVSKAGHASMHSHTAAVGTTPTTDEKSFPVGIVVIVLVTLIVISRLATCGDSHQAAYATPKKDQSATQKTPAESLFPKTGTGTTTAAAATAEAEQKSDEPKPVRPEGWGDPRFNSMETNRQQATGTVTFPQPVATPTSSNDGSTGEMAN